MASPRCCQSANNDLALCNLSANDTSLTDGDAWRRFSKYRCFRSSQGGLGGVSHSVQPSIIAITISPKR